MKKPAQLPDPLRYLQPFANSLAKMRPEDLNEDIESSRLDAALRKRVRGMDADAIDAELTKDRVLLENWLKDKPDHPAHWIRGYLLFPELATHLIRPAGKSPLGPDIMFEAPVGWKAKKFPFRMDLKAGEVIGSILAIDELTFSLVQRQREQAMNSRFSTGSDLRSHEHEGTIHVTDVSFEKCSGRKFLFLTISPTPWKQVDYVLRVPGGYVSIGLGTTTGADFDESTLESRLHTLRLEAFP